GGRGRRGGAHLVDDGPERAVEVGGSAHPVDEADGARGLGAHVVVEQRELLGPAEPDDPREAQHGAIRDEPVPRGAQADHGLVGGEAQVAGERQLEPAADRVPVQHRERDLRHVLEAVQRADPVAVERLADSSGRQRLPVHARGERPAGTTYDDESDGGIGSRRLLATAAAIPAALRPWPARGATAVKIGTAVLGDYSMAGPVIVARERGLFAREGLAAEFVPFRGGPDLLKAVMAGEILVGITGSTDILVFREAGSPIKAIATHTEGNHFTLNVAPDVHTVAELKGKAIGVTRVGA